MTSPGTCGWSYHMPRSVEIVFCRCRTFHDGKSTHDLFHVVQFVCVVKLNCDVVWLDRHHGTNGMHTEKQIVTLASIRLLQLHDCPY